MLEPSRPPLTDAEAAAIDALLARHGARASFARRDPGESGPVVVEVAGRRFEVDTAGEVSES